MFCQHRKISAFSILALLLGLFCLSACGTLEDKRVYKYNNSGKTITTTLGDSFVIRLPVNYRVGAKWEIVELDRSIVREDGPVRQLNTVIVGGLATITNYSFPFKAVARGESELKMVLLKPGVEKPLDQFETHIVVK